MAERKPRGVSDVVGRGVSGVAGETLKTTGVAARGATSGVSGATGMDAVEGVEEQVQAAAGSVGGAVERAVRGGAQHTVGEELREIVREAALEVLVPAARKATMQAATYAIRRGPQLARDTIAPKLADTLGAAIEEAGGPGAFAKGALSSVAGARSGMLEKVGIGGESQFRPWRERRLPAEESIDVAVPLETAYDGFAEFEEYANFMSRGETVDERPDERIVWERTDGEATAIITFHRLSDRLTRVMVTYDQQPPSLLEKTTSLFRTLRHSLSADLMRYKAFVEMSEEDVETPEEEPGQQAEESRARRRTRGRHDEDAEQHESAEEEGEDEQEGEDEEEPAPAAGRPVRRRAAARPRQQTARTR
jgi:hypothetical protein